jgi:hypothetical protein
MAVRWRIRVFCSTGMDRDRGMARGMVRGGIDESLRECRYMCESDYPILQVDAGRMLLFVVWLKIGLEWKHSVYRKTNGRTDG